MASIILMFGITNTVQNDVIRLAAGYSVNFFADRFLPDGPRAVALAPDQMERHVDAIGGNYRVISIIRNVLHVPDEVIPGAQDNEVYACEGNRRS
jgi:hypothetical protein